MTSVTPMLYYKPLKRIVFVAVVNEEHSESVLVGNRIVVCFWNPQTKVWCEDRLTEFEPAKIP